MMEKSASQGCVMWKERGEVSTACWWTKDSARRIMNWMCWQEVPSSSPFVEDRWLKAKSRHNDGTWANKRTQESNLWVTDTLHMSKINPVTPEQTFKITDLNLTLCKSLIASLVMQTLLLPELRSLLGELLGSLSLPVLDHYAHDVFSSGCLQRFPLTLSF